MKRNKLSLFLCAFALFLAGCGETISPSANTVTDTTTEIQDDGKMYGSLNMKAEPVQFIATGKNMDNPKQVTASDLLATETGEVVSITSPFVLMYSQGPTYYNFGQNESGTSYNYLYLDDDFEDISELTRIPRVPIALVLGNIVDYPKTGWFGGTKQELENKILILASADTFDTVLTAIKGSASTGTQIDIKATGEYVGIHNVENIHEDGLGSNQWSMPVILATKLEVVPTN